MTDFFLPDTVQTVTAAGRWLVVTWMFVLGAMLGSFMNVVVYRVPRRMSLNRPGSRCPACLHPIRWHDNVPIFGWLWLGGRCRDCRAAISVRYPLVEAMMAVTSAAIGWTRGTVPLPTLGPNGEETFAVHLGVFAFHLTLLGTLYCAALMEYDGHLAPPRMLGLVLAFGLVVGAVWPGVRGAMAVDVAAFEGLSVGLLGILSAILLATLAWPAWIGFPGHLRLMRALTAATELELTGTFLGVRSVSIIAVASLALYVVCVMSGWVWPAARRWNWTASLAVSTLAVVVCGPKLDESPAWLATQSDGAVFIGAGLCVGVLAAVAYAMAVVMGRLRRS